MTPLQTALVFLLIAILLFSIALLWSLFGPGRYTLLERILYAPVYLLSRVMWRVELEWVERWPPASEAPAAAPLVSRGLTTRGIPAFETTAGPNRDAMLGDRWPRGAVLVANHRCSLDPFFVQLIAGRRVHWMVAGEYFRTPLVGGLLRAFEAIPTNRGGIDTKAIKRAIAMAASGRFVGMFPEGRINRSQSPLLSIRPGAATVALRAGVPLVPIWIEGAPVGPSIFSPLLTPAKVRVIVGPPDDWGLKMARHHRSGLASPMPEMNHSTPTSPPLPGSTLLHDNLHASAGTPDTLPMLRGGDAEMAGMPLDDRAICEAWIHRVMQASLQQAGRCGESIAMAGKNWVQET